MYRKRLPILPSLFVLRRCLYIVQPFKLYIFYPPHLSFFRRLIIPAPNHFFCRNLCLQAVTAFAPDIFIAAVISRPLSYVYLTATATAASQLCYTKHILLIRQTEKIVFCFCMQTNATAAGIIVNTALTIPAAVNAITVHGTSS